jgi:hypothetical protein
MQFQLNDEPASLLEPAKRGNEFSVNKISQGRLIESTINQIVNEYKVKLNSKKNRIPKPLLGDSVMRKQVQGGSFTKIKR